MSGGYNLPDGLSKSDLDHIYGNDGGYSDWVHDNLEELQKEFLEDGWLEEDLGSKRFDRFCETTWEKKCAEAGHFDE